MRYKIEVVQFRGEAHERRRVVQDNCTDMEIEGEVTQILLHAMDPDVTEVVITLVEE